MQENCNRTMYRGRRSTAVEISIRDTIIMIAELARAEKTSAAAAFSNSNPIVLMSKNNDRAIEATI